MVTAEERLALAALEERGADFYAQILYLVLTRRNDLTATAKLQIADRIVAAFTDLTTELGA